MNSTEIIEGNKLIAEFMGLNYTNLINGIWFDMQNNGHRNIEIMNDAKNYALYHSDWNWLMPVVDKIEHLYADKNSLPRFEINSHNCRFAISYPRKYRVFIAGCYNDSPEEIKANSKIEAAWMVAVEFIKYYNKQKQQ